MSFCSSCKKNREQRLKQQIIDSLQFTRSDSTLLETSLFLANACQYRQELNSANYNKLIRISDSLYVLNISSDSISYILNIFLNQDYNRIIKEQEDLKGISYKEIIRHAHESLLFYGKEWNKHLSTKQYLEWVCPYRVDNEQLENWRSYIIQNLRQTMKISLDSGYSATELCTILNDHLKKNRGIEIKEIIPQNIGLPPHTLLKMTSGSCKNYCNLGCFVMRSFGLPVCIDGMPNGHTWNVLLTPEGIIDFSTCEYSPNENHLKRWLEYMEYKRLPRSYRQMFIPDSNSLALQNVHEAIPLFFQSPFYKDVTNEYYIGETHSIEIKNQIQKKEFVYLSIFNKGFIYLTWARKNKNLATFTHLTDSILYFPCYYSTSNTFEAFNYPFFINKDKAIHYFKPDTLHKQTMVLWRKYHVKRHHNLFLKRAIGGRFEGANKANFSDAVLLHEIKNLPPMKMTYVDIVNPSGFQYFRYLSPDSSYCSIAEIKLYDGTQHLIYGNIIGTNGHYVQSPNCVKENVFDGDVLSYFDAPNPNEAWVGMQFSDKRCIKKIGYIMRNDDNFVQEGQCYELLYMDKNGWKSMGKKTAIADSIVYQNVPSGAAYLLKNHTKGKEERIFTYENGQQIWW